jgi:hypothetical protein
MTWTTRLGSRTTAHFVQGLLDGELDLTRDDGFRFIGRARRGSLEGPCRIELPDSRVATGSFDRGEPDGIWNVTERNGMRSEIEVDRGVVKRGELQLPRITVPVPRI